MGEMRTNPFIVLVCLLFLVFQSIAESAGSGSFIKITIDNNTIKTERGEPVSLQPAMVRHPKDVVSFRPASASVKRPGLLAYPVLSSPKPITKCKPSGCELPGVCMPEPGIPCILPMRNCRQWEFSVQGFFARTRGKISWPLHPTVDFNDGLGLDSHKTLFEYSARYQFRPNWALYYSIMPIELESHYTPVMFPGTIFKSKWENYYQQVGIMYQPIRSCSAAISIYSGWFFNDERLTMDSGDYCVANRVRKIDRTRNMVISGIELQKCIRTMCNGGSLSCDSKVGIAYLDGAFGLDVQTGLQYSIPLNCGRWGYAKGGYRLINLKEDRNDSKIDTFLEGWFTELGIVF
jgi:hypothetical protein